MQRSGSRASILYNSEGESIFDEDEYASLDGSESHYSGRRPQSRGALNPISEQRQPLQFPPIKGDDSIFSVDNVDTGNQLSVVEDERKFLKSAGTLSTLKDVETMSFKTGNQTTSGGDNRGDFRGEEEHDLMPGSDNFKGEKRAYFLAKKNSSGLPSFRALARHPVSLFFGLRNAPPPVDETGMRIRPRYKGLEGKPRAKSVSPCAKAMTNPLTSLDDPAISEYHKKSKSNLEVHLGNLLRGDYVFRTEKNTWQQSAFRPPHKKISNPRDEMKRLEWNYDRYFTHLDETGIKKTNPKRTLYEQQCTDLVLDAVIAQVANSCHEQGRVLVKIRERYAESFAVLESERAALKMEVKRLKEVIEACEREKEELRKQIQEKGDEITRKMSQEVIEQRADWEAERGVYEKRLAAAVEEAGRMKHTIHALNTLWKNFKEDRVVELESAVNQTRDTNTQYELLLANASTTIAEKSKEITRLSDLVKEWEARHEEEQRMLMEMGIERHDENELSASPAPSPPGSNPPSAPPSAPASAASTPRGSTPRGCTPPVVLSRAGSRPGTSHSAISGRPVTRGSEATAILRRKLSRDDTSTDLLRSNPLDQLCWKCQKKLGDEIDAGSGDEISESEHDSDSSASDMSYNGGQKYTRGLSHSKIMKRKSCGLKRFLKKYEKGQSLDVGAEGIMDVKSLLRICRDILRAKTMEDMMLERGVWYGHGTTPPPVEHFPEFVYRYFQSSHQDLEAAETAMARLIMSLRKHSKAGHEIDMMRCFVEEVFGIDELCFFIYCRHRLMGSPVDDQLEHPILVSSCQRIWEAIKSNMSPESKIGFGDMFKVLVDDKGFENSKGESCIESMAFLRLLLQIYRTETATRRYQMNAQGKAMGDPKGRLSIFQAIEVLQSTTPGAVRLDLIFRTWRMAWDLSGGKVKAQSLIVAAYNANFFYGCLRLPPMCGEFGAIAEAEDVGFEMVQSRWDLFSSVVDKMIKPNSKTADRTAFEGTIVLRKRLALYKEELEDALGDQEQLRRSAFLYRRILDVVSAHQVILGDVEGSWNHELQNSDLEQVEEVVRSRFFLQNKLTKGEEEKMKRKKLFHDTPPPASPKAMKFEALEEKGETLEEQMRRQREAALSNIASAPPPDGVAEGQQSSWTDKVSEKVASLQPASRARGARSRAKK